MPLLRRKLYTLERTPPPPDIDGNTQVFQIPYTAEIFYSYEDFIKQVTLYSKPIWQCASSGKQNLTFLQALESERRLKEEIETTIPEPLKKPILQKIQYATERLDQVVEDVFNSFKNRFVQDEVVNVKMEGKFWPAKVVHVTKCGGEIVEDIVTCEEDDLEYHIRFFDEDWSLLDGIRVIKVDFIKRDRLALSKTLLRKFIRDSSTKDTFVGAPFMVKAELQSKYGINQQPPEPLKQLLDSRTKRKMAENETSPLKKVKSEPIPPTTPKTIRIRYPIEDSELTMDDRKSEGQMPTLSFSFQIPSECVPTLLAVWQFLITFGDVLNLFPFPLDHFEATFFHKSSFLESTIVKECYEALFSLLKKQGFSKRLLSKSWFRTLWRENPSSEMEIENEDNFLTQENQISENPIRSKLQKLNHSWSNMEETKNSSDLIIRCLLQFATVETFPDFRSLFERMTNSEQNPNSYDDLSIEEKLFILHFLCCEALQCPTIHSIIEDSIIQSKHLKFEKREINKELKKINEQRKNLYIVEQSENGQDGVMENLSDTEFEVLAVQDQDNENPTSDEEEETSELDSRQSRRAKLQYIQEQRRLEEMRKQEEQERMKTKSQEQRARYQDRKKLNDRERALFKRCSQIDKELRKNALLRVRALGRDRYHHRYWWFDGIGAGSRMPYGIGRLFVQTFQSKNEKVEPVSPVDPFEKEQWGYYSEENQIEELLQWLNPKGVREFHLSLCLKQVADDLKAVISKRQQDLVSIMKQESRTITTRSISEKGCEPHMLYINKWRK